MCTIKMAFWQHLADLLAGRGDGSDDEEEERGLLEGESGDSEDGAVEQDRQLFDPTLPTQHLYLGDLERDGGHLGDVHEAEEVATLPLLPMSVGGTFILPGETLPLNTVDIPTKMLLREARSRGQMVALAWDIRNVPYWMDLPRPTLKDLCPVAVVAEIVGMREGVGEDPEEAEVLAHGGMVVKLVGRLRCKLLEMHGRINGTLEAKVVVLPEQPLPPIPPFHLACPPNIIRSAAAARGFLCSESSRQLSQDVVTGKLRHVALVQQVASVTQVPTWLYHKHQMHAFRAEILKEQQMMTIFSSQPSAVTKQQQQQHVPDDIVTLSYWLVKRLPVSIPVKIDLIAINCPNRRLMKGLQILQDFTELQCAHCGTLITEKQHIFSLSVDGPLASYVNPGGYVHDTLTVREVRNIRLQGQRTTEHSWFPQYAWTILNCKSCRHHLGWRFDCTKKGLQPPHFYGLSRGSLKLMSRSAKQHSPSR